MTVNQAGLPLTPDATMAKHPLSDMHADILASLEQGIVVQDRAGAIIFSNPAAANMLGLSVDQMQGRSSLDPRWQAIHEDGSAYPGDTHPAMRTLADGMPVRGDIMGIHKPDGTLTWISVNTEPLGQHRNTLPQAVAAIFTDISLQRGLQAELETSQARFNQLAQNIDIVFWVGSPDWKRIDYVSPAYEPLWQRPVTNLLDNGMDWLEAVLDEDRATLLDHIPQAHDWKPFMFPPYRIRRGDGSIRWIQAKAFPIVDMIGHITSVAGVAQDITERYEEQLHLTELAHLDSLTQLPNRSLLSDRMHQGMAHCRRTGSMMAVCLLDLDGFKAVNDTLGHEAGDALLIQLASRLTQAVRADDTVARLGGDEFVLLLGHIDGAGEAEATLQRVLTAIALPYSIHDHAVSISASIGVTFYPSDNGDSNTLLRHADHAMYLAKQAGKNRIHMFNPVLEIRDRENRNALANIRRAIQHQQFELHYQPIIDSRRGRVAAVEALIRWNHPVLGILPASEFLPLLQSDNALTLQLGLWVLEGAIHQAECWHRQGMDLGVHINLFAGQVQDSSVVDIVKNLLGRHPILPAERITLEVMESCALDSIVATRRLIEGSQATGIKLALDDFGTGNTSISRLRRFPVHMLKIDKSFIRNMLLDPEDMTIVEAIISLGMAYGHHVVAEGVENLDQIWMLTEMGCHMVQGYALAHPMAADAIPAWINRFTPDPRWRMNAMRHLDRDDFQLLLAESHHQQWHSQLISWLRGDEGTRGDPPCLDPAGCNFGRWYHGDGMERYSHLAAFQEAGRQHEHLHGIAQALVQQRLQATSSGCRELEARLQDSCEVFTHALAQLRRDVSRPIGSH